MMLQSRKEAEIELFLLGLAWCYKIHGGQTTIETQKLLQSYTTLKLVYIHLPFLLCPKLFDWGCQEEL